MKTAMVLEADWREAYWQLLGEGMPVFLAVRPPRPAGTPPEEGNEILNPTVASRSRFLMKACWPGLKG